MIKTTENIIFKIKMLNTFQLRSGKSMFAIQHCIGGLSQGKKIGKKYKRYRSHKNSKKQLKLSLFRKDTGM